MFEDKKINGNVCQARMNGYYFDLNEDGWKLSKDIIVYPKNVTQYLKPEMKYGYIKTLSFFAMEYSSGHTRKINQIFTRWGREFELTVIDKDSILDFKSHLGKNHEHRIKTIKNFILKWHEFGYQGVDISSVQLLKRLYVKSAIHGDSVKRKDPNYGPFNQDEVESILKHIHALNAGGKIRVDTYCFLLLLIYTGRRTQQISSLRIKDIVNTEGELSINIPRVKQRKNFRTEFSSVELTEFLYEQLIRLSQSVLNVVEKQIGEKLNDKISKELPLFFSKRELALCSNKDILVSKTNSDFLHTKNRPITKRINNLFRINPVFSPRTGKPLKVNPARFRYTLGSELARNGASIHTIAKALDQSSVACSGIYIKNHADNASEIDKRMGVFLEPLSKLFLGVEPEINTDRFIQLMRSTFHVEEIKGNTIHCKSCRFFESWGGLYEQYK
ncbi:tyrosine-type recombinase/integrase [Pantoea vagans]|uniref:tyrosine-type recombinase/integrase n=1 Tax=Pantoea vagans TaxID=470934 RepID=UPI0023B00AFA|nr:tyrosine-type recombinase/integrase [Pantoea vagans]MDE8558844.1 tyrosine-type recombinase/integrase [Pantoea vagans]MDE8578849.1 tyrosine-type recombinase/integrase [Pantoea vagans]